MTSETQEVWVWVYLPGDTEPALCGRYQHATQPGGGAVGKFIYGKNYLANPSRIPLDPISLPLVDKTHEFGLLRGVFPALLDAMPDDWGRYVIDRIHGQQAYPMGYMLKASDDRIGNLTFSAERLSAPMPSRFATLKDIPTARAVLQGLEEARVVPPELLEVIEPTTAMGGARPKLTVDVEGELWMAKFPARNDSALFPVAKVEAAMLNLARRCDIDASQARVVEDDVLLVKRFDRAAVRNKAGLFLGWRRDSFLSARTVFYSRPDVQANSFTGSYPRLAEELSRWSAAPSLDREELFKRMVFNACVSNTDDHERNHGFLADDEPGAYRLSPAFDIVPRVHGTRRRLHALILGNEGAQATRGNLLSDCARFGLRPAAAEAIFEHITQMVKAHWRACLIDQCVGEQVLLHVEGCFGCEFN